jgi:hypothetical protein
MSANFNLQTLMNSAIGSVQTFSIPRPFRLPRCPKPHRNRTGLYTQGLTTFSAFKNMTPKLVWVKSGPASEPPLVVNAGQVQALKPS